MWAICDGHIGRYKPISLNLVVANNAVSLIRCFTIAQLAAAYQAALATTSSARAAIVEELFELGRLPKRVNAKRVAGASDPKQTEHSLANRLEKWAETTRRASIHR